MRIDAQQRARKRVLHQHVGGDDHGRHQEDVEKRNAVHLHFFTLGDATSWSLQQFRQSIEACPEPVKPQ
jgi:hypothetical protein